MSAARARAAAQRPPRAFLRDNGLTIALAALFLFSIAAMGLTGWQAHNSDLLEHGAASLGLVGYLLSGAFVIENVFAWPGIGRFSVQALQWRDYPTIQGVVMITAFIFLTINLLVDMLYAIIDPRIRVH